MQFKKVVAPFLNGIHCFAHKMNLVVIILFDLPIVHRLEGVLQSLYFFAHSPKKIPSISKASKFD
jgi:hypothetical protein